MELRTLVVCGATGKQGGSVVNALVDDGTWRVVGLSRNPDGAPAQALRDRGVEVRKADLADRSSLVAAFDGAYGVYGVSTPETAKGKVDSELDRLQGRNVAEAVAEAGVRHLVMSTVMYVEEGQEDSLPYLRPKAETERYVAELAIPSTFIRPASFMDEIGGEFLPVKRGVVTGQADNDAKVPYVACRDIGKMAALAFAEPERFIGKRINLIGDFLSGDELAEVLTRVTGEPHRHKAPPIPLMWVFAREWIPLRRQFEAWGRPPHPPAIFEGIEESRELLPDLLTFETYLRSVEFQSA